MDDSVVAQPSNLHIRKTFFPAGRNCLGSETFLKGKPSADSMQKFHQYNPEDEEYNQYADEYKYAMTLTFHAG